MLTPIAFMTFLVIFGLLVVVPVVAIITGNHDKSQPRDGNRKVDAELLQKLKDLESTVAKQQNQIEDLKELVHVNILKMEDMSTLQHRIDTNK